MCIRFIMSNKTDKKTKTKVEPILEDIDELDPIVDTQFVFSDPHIPFWISLIHF